MTAERDQNIGPDHTPLLLKKRRTTEDFVRQRVAILRGAAFYEVGYEHVAALDAERVQNFGQELAGFADKRAAAQVFIVAGGFTDKEQPRGKTAFAEDNVRPALLKAAAGAVGDLEAQLIASRDGEQKVLFPEFGPLGKEFSKA
jgi:hypothetical protein